MAYYNTAGEIIPDLESYIQIAKKQDDKVLSVFYKYSSKDIPLTGWAVYNLYINLYNIPNDGSLVTSIRRSIDTLKKNNLLVNLGSIVTDYGKGRKELQYILKCHDDEEKPKINESKQLELF